MHDRFHIHVRNQIGKTVAVSWCRPNSTWMKEREKKLNKLQRHKLQGYKVQPRAKSRFNKRGLIEKSGIEEQPEQEAQATLHAITKRPKKKGGKVYSETTGKFYLIS